MFSVNPGTNHPFEVVIVGAIHVNDVNRDRLVWHVSYREQCKPCEPITVSVNGVRMYAR